MSKVWIIEPRDPLIVRDGRPFGPTPGARAATLPFPLPSTMAGGVRTQSGLDNKTGIFTLEPEEARQIPIQGPLLIDLKDNDPEWYAPAPADALLLAAEPGDSAQALRKWLAPLPQTSGETNLPPGLRLVGMRSYDPRKPLKEPPRFWHWRAFDQWLLAPGDDAVHPEALGIDGPVEEARIHVKINIQTGIAEEGALFQTRGLVFEAWNRRLALAVRSSKQPAFSVGPLGGERRIAAWRTVEQDFPVLPSNVKKTIVSQKRCRLILLTPAIFGSEKEGPAYTPNVLLKGGDGVQPHLEAAAVRRYQVVSGWDLEKKRPKPTRRLTPAGSVFFLRLEGDDAAIGRWVENHWMTNISDAEQDQLDGFGLAVLGVWPETAPSKEEI